MKALDAGNTGESQRKRRQADKVVVRMATEADIDAILAFRLGMMSHRNNLDNRFRTLRPMEPKSLQCGCGVPSAPKTGAAGG